MGTGTAVATGDLITAAKMNLKLESFGPSEEQSTFGALRLLTSVTLPAGTVAYIGLDNTNDVTINALVGGIVAIAIAGTDEFQFDATSFIIASGNLIDFDGLAGANRDLLRDVNNNELLTVFPVASAVNELEIRNAATGAGPQINAIGDDANVPLLLSGKGTGAIIVDNGTDPVDLRLMGAAAGFNNVISDLNGNELLDLQGVASAVNQFSVINAATGNTPDLLMRGGDANISMTLSAKAAGAITLRTNSTTSRVRINDAFNITLFQTSFNYTLAWSDPSAARTITIPDPGAADSFVFLAATQSISGKTVSLSGDLTFSAALDIEVATNTAATLEINAGATAWVAFDSRNTTDNVIGILITPVAPTIAGVAGTTFRAVGVAAYSLTTSTATTITALNGLSLNLGVPTVAQSGGAVTVTTASSLFVSAPVAGASVTITNRYIINTDIAGCFCTAAGVWTDTSNRQSKTDIRPLDLASIPELMDTIELVSFRKQDSSDGGFLRFGVIAEDVPDFLATPGRQGVAAIYVAGFALATTKYLKSEQDTMRGRIAELELEVAELRARGT